MSDEYDRFVLVGWKLGEKKKKNPTRLTSYSLVLEYFWFGYGSVHKERIFEIALFR